MRLLVGRDDAGGDAAALVDLVTVGPGPLADLGGAVVAAEARRAAAGAGGTAAADPAGRAD